MEIIKLSMVLDNGWLEATWNKEVSLTNDIEKDGKIVQEEYTTTEQIHCESFSGHREHISMLEERALEFQTSLEEYSDLIKLAKECFVYPTEEELADIESQNKIQEARSYLGQTDWIKDYKLRHDLGLEAIPENSSKWLILAKREEYICYLKGLEI